MFWFLRHGARADLEDKDLHKVHCQRFPSTDPTLTAEGLHMATESGKYLKSKLLSDHPGKKFLIMSSPYLRCLQTARNIANELGPEALSDNTLHVEDALEEWWNSNAGVEESTRDNLIFHTLGQNPELSKEIFHDLDYKHNSLLSYNIKKVPLSMVWEESLRDASSRCIFRWVEIGKLQQSPEFKDLVIISVGHGICSTAQRYLTKDKSITAGDYCCIQKISITPNPEPKNGGEKYNFEFPVLNHYAYKRNSTGGKIWFVRHSQRADKNDRPLFEKHLQNGFSGTDSCLTPKGKEMAQQTGEYLKAHKPPQIQKYLIITSPYYRCIETAVGITAGLGLDLVHNNCIYVEDAFEEWASPVAHIKKTSQAKRAYPTKFLSDPTLTEQTFGQGLTHMHNTLLNYSGLNTPLRVTFPERYDHLQNRFLYRSLELIKSYSKGEYENIMFVVVTHGCLKDCIEAFTNIKRDWIEYCGVSQVESQDGKTLCSVFNQLGYDFSSLGKEVELGKEHYKL